MEFYQKVPEDVGYIKDAHQFAHRPFLDIHGQEKTTPRLPYPEIYNQPSISPRQHVENQNQEKNLYPQVFDRQEQEKIVQRQMIEAYRRESREFGKIEEESKGDYSQKSDDHEKAKEAISPRQHIDNQNQEKQLYPQIFERQENIREREMIEAYRQESREFGQMGDDIKGENSQKSDSQDKDIEEGREQKEESNQLNDGLKKCPDSMEDFQAAIKRADTVSPQVADVVEKVMSEENSLIENHEGYNLSNASFQDTNSNSSDDQSEYLTNNVTSDSTATYVRDPNTGHVTTIKPDKEGLYFCHLCSFSGRTQADFENHMTCHFEHICPHCDYKSRTEGRLKRHIKDFHTDDPPDGFGSKRNMGRPKVFRCKQCEFVATEKTEFWAHARAHIKDDKVLQCPRCPFVTEYKHHLEYHLRNHFGSKPFKCNKCNYSCVNKSMLNSHMKSHTNVYQYRCADCTYATKYCHSLKLHLRKYQHKPATVLNSDGSLPQGIDADASGLSLLQKRGPPRGPRGPRKDKFDPYMNSMFNLPQSPIHGMPPGMGGAMMSPYWPLLSQLPNGFHRPPPLIPTSSPMSMNPSIHSPQLPQHLSSKMGAPKTPDGDNSSNYPFKCNFCCYGTGSKQELYKHLMKVHATENQDLFSMFGLSSEALLEEQNRRLSLMKHKMEERNLDDSLNDELHIHTDGEDEDQKYSPHSWSHPSPIEPAKINRNNGRYSMPELPVNYYRNGNASPKDIGRAEGEDIIKQMMNKFGAGSPMNAARPKMPHQRESPLDLTKRKYPFSSSPLSQEEMYNREMNPDGDAHSSGESTTANDNNGQSPRKRSRKGKAFKLDRLCLKLHDKHDDAENGSENEESEFLESESAGDLQIDESSNMDGEMRNVDERNETDENGKKDDDIEEIKNSLQYLNEGMVKSQVEKAPERKSPDSTRNQSGDEVASSQAITSSQDVISSANREQAELSMQTSQALRHQTELAWKMLQNSGSGGHFPYMSLEQNGHHQDLAKLTTAAQQMIAMNNRKSGPNGKYECAYCEIAFKDCVMYTMHMGYHGYKDPFKCNMCGHCSKDKVEFFLHIARAAHN
ncbi:uncharacterized protein LOC134690799 isoform X3 [Mytilus trossulus]|uniref:uncharacterized protein LOC134690799 isoform X3 n=1 Tax=Mytilus trossulus TaxID=6551 RepID=UPI003006B6F5